MPPERIETVHGLPPRPADSHKGRFGSILVIAGSRGMAGAAALCGAGALRSGAGLARIVSPAEVQPTVASFEPSYMTYPLPQDADGIVDFPAARPILERWIDQADVLAVGPGLGQSEGVRELVRWLLEHSRRPVVIDADALNALAGQTDRLNGLSHPVVLTPHPGECARLLGTSMAAVQGDREGHAARLSGTSGNVVTVLKGHGTIITDGTRIAINATGNPGMATGGVGDVLTGVIAALIGQGLSHFEAAVLGAHAHGLAGDLARDQNGEVGLIAGDVVDSLADAFFHLAG